MKVTLSRLKIHWKCFKIGIRNLIHYFKVIWRDRDWDWSFMIYLQKRKLDSMISYYTENKCFEGQDSEVRYMKIARYCLENISVGSSEMTLPDGTKRYVNDKNFERIREANGQHPVNRTNFWEDFKRKNEEYYYEDVYEEKLWYIYNKIIQMRAKNWWD